MYTQDVALEAGKVIFWGNDFLEFLETIQSEKIKSFPMLWGWNNQSFPTPKMRVRAKNIDIIGIIWAPNLILKSLTIENN